MEVNSIISLPETETKKKVDEIRSKYRYCTFGEGYFEEMGCEHGDGRAFEFITNERGLLIIFYHPSRFTFVFEVLTAKMHLFDNNVLLEDFYFSPRCEIEIFLTLDQVKPKFIQYLIEMLATVGRTIVDKNTIKCGPYRVVRFKRPKESNIQYGEGEPKSVIYFYETDRELDGIHTTTPFNKFLGL